MKTRTTGLGAFACLLALALGACVSAGQREVDEARRSLSQREVWRLVAMDGQELPAKMPNGQEVRRANLFLTGPQFPKGFRIWFQLTGWRRSPRTANEYHGSIVEPVPAGQGRMQALVLYLARTEMAADVESNDRVTRLDEKPIVTFIGERLWVTIEGHMMVFERS